MGEKTHPKKLNFIRRETMLRTRFLQHKTDINIMPACLFAE